MFIRENSLKQKLSILDALRIYILKNGDFAALLNEDDLQTVISIWCTIYFSSLRNLKLCQKVRKVKWLLHVILVFDVFFLFSHDLELQSDNNKANSRETCTTCVSSMIQFICLTIVPNFSCQWVLQSSKDSNWLKMLMQVFGGNQGEWHCKSGKLQEEDPLLWQVYHSTEPE